MQLKLTVKEFSKEGILEVIYPVKLSWLNYNRSHSSLSFSEKAGASIFLAGRANSYLNPMLQFSRTPFVLGIAFTAMGLVIGYFATHVSTFTCIRHEMEQQGICRLKQSTLFLPWNKQVTSFQLNDIQKAESV
ncbi:hypothetical protein [Phormidesmis priestleyi]|uniref:hypothetical protein n=1 Tax=Phormidesmis priestleyi TaxID=268141 RepID=UPI00083AA085|nr:hypothetical protein [Phormidesmis priestleyi]